MTTSRVTVGGVTALALVLHVPLVGPWWAEAVLEDATAVSGAVELSIGETLTLSGTVAPRASGAFGEGRSVRIVAGAGGWASLLGAQGYHNDGGVSARLVASDAAAAAGETLGDFAPSATTLGADYVRSAGAASRALEEAAGTAAWWVGFDGRTNVGTRPTSTPTAGSFEVLDFDPVGRVATLGMDDLASIAIGSVIPADTRIPEALTVRELRIEVTGDAATVLAWCGGTDGTRGRVAGTLRAIVERVVDDMLLGPKRYRVFRMSSDRVELQAVSPGLPNIGPISMSPGVAGAHAELTPGSIVLVTFVDGDRTLPMITHFAGKDGTGWTPANLTLDATTLIKLGADAANFVALANLVSARLDVLQNAHDTHKHATAATGPAVIPDVIVGPLASVAATKVRAQ